MRFKGGVLAMAAIAILAGQAHGRIWYILPDGSGDATTIAAGVDSSSFGDTVLLADGEHFIDYADIIVPDGVAIIGEHGPEHTLVRKRVWISTADSPFSAFQVIGAGSETMISGLWMAGDYQGAPSHFIGVICTDSSTILSNLVFFDEHWVENEKEGVRCLRESQPMIEQCTMITTYGIVALNGSKPIVRHNIVVGFHAYYCRPLIPGSYDGKVESSCNDLIGDPVGCGLGPGDFSEPSMFCDSTGLRLDATSPCVHGYGCGLIGALGIDCGATVTESTTWGSIKVLFD